jgi:hypothetical protein
MNMSKSISKQDLERMLQEAQSKVSALADENQRLKVSLSKRPADALCVSTNLVFQKGSHLDLVGKTLKLSIPQEAVGALHISGVVKKNSNGNAYVWCSGYIDTSKLNLVTSQVVSTPADQAKQSFKDAVVEASK